MGPLIYQSKQKINKLQYDIDVLTVDNLIIRSEINKDEIRQQIKKKRQKTNIIMTVNPTYSMHNFGLDINTIPYSLSYSRTDEEEETYDMPNFGSTNKSLPPPVYF